MNSQTDILLCCDLESTVLPIGSAPVSPYAADIFRKTVSRGPVTLAYISEGDLKHIKSAIREHHLPYPDLIIGDMGATAYAVSKRTDTAHRFRQLKAWEDSLAPYWHGLESDDLADMLGDIQGIRLQEDDAQRTYKLSYFADSAADDAFLVQQLKNRLEDEKIKAEVTLRVDEETDMGLIDIVPAGAGKMNAMRFMMNRFGTSERETVYAGDSMNDEAIHISTIPSVVVRNASQNLRKSVLARSVIDGTQNYLYFARGNFFGMNGNYVAGVLEGLYHFQMRIRSLIARVCEPYQMALILG